MGSVKRTFCFSWQTSVCCRWQQGARGLHLWGRMFYLTGLRCCSIKRSCYCWQPQRRTHENCKEMPTHVENKCCQHNPKTHISTWSFCAQRISGQDNCWAKCWPTESNRNTAVLRHNASTLRMENLFLLARFLVDYGFSHPQGQKNNFVPNNLACSTQVRASKISHNCSRMHSLCHVNWLLCFLSMFQRFPWHLDFWDIWSIMLWWDNSVEKTVVNRNNHIKAIITVTMSIHSCPLLPLTAKSAKREESLSLAMKTNPDL